MSYTGITPELQFGRWRAVRFTHTDSMHDRRCPQKNVPRLLKSNSPGTKKAPVSKLPTGAYSWLEGCRWSLPDVVLKDSGHRCKPIISITVVSRGNSIPGSDTQISQAVIRIAYSFGSQMHCKFFKLILHRGAHSTLDENDVKQYLTGNGVKFTGGTSSLPIFSFSIVYHVCLRLIELRKMRNGQT